jgi:hypothetical protein
MSALLPISKLRRQRLLNEIRASLSAGLDVDKLSNFLASVDWSGAGTNRPRIADELGKIEAWTTQYTESFISHTQFVARLLSLLPERERNWLLFFDSPPLRITLVPWAGRMASPQLVRAGQPETESDAPHPPVPDKPENKILLAA